MLFVRILHVLEKYFIIAMRRELDGMCPTGGEPPQRERMAQRSCSNTLLCCKDVTAPTQVKEL